MNVAQARWCQCLEDGAIEIIKIEKILSHTTKLGMLNMKYVVLLI